MTQKVLQDAVIGKFRMLLASALNSLIPSLGQVTTPILNGKLYRHLGCTRSKDCAISVTEHVCELDRCSGVCLALLQYGRVLESSAFFLCDYNVLIMWFITA